MLNVVILADDWVAEMNALNRPAAFSGTQIAMFNVTGFLTGLGGAWLYAANSRLPCWLRAT